MIKKSIGNDGSSVSLTLQAMASGILSSTCLRSGCRSTLSFASASATAEPLVSASATTPRILRSSFLPAVIIRGRNLNHCSVLGSEISLWSDVRNSGLAYPLRQRVGSGVLTVRAARMESQSTPLAFRAPDFELPEPLTGKTWKLDDFEDQQGLLVMFICNHCPFVVHLKENLASFAKEYQQKGLGVVAISSNSVVTHPQDGPQYMAEDATKYGYPFPYLFDETQEVAKAYGAVCTPDFFLFKKDGRKPFELAYHGRFDETRPRSNAPITGRDLRAAANALLSGQPVPRDQRPSIGCSIKWKPGK